MDMAYRKSQKVSNPEVQSEKWKYKAVYYVAFFTICIFDFAFYAVREVL